MEKLLLKLNQRLCRHRWRYHIGDFLTVQAAKDWSGTVLLLKCAKCGKKADFDL